MDQADLLGAVEALTTAVGELSNRMDATQDVLDELTRQGKELDRQGRAQRSTRIAVAVTLIAAVAIGLLYYRVEQNTQEVRALQARTNSEILCPLYKFLALSLSANPANPTASAEQLALRKTAADTISAGLVTLGCA